MTVKGGTSPACAACKHQRRKCSSDCVLAPYFPENQSKTFLNAHRLFGVSNILKTLKHIDGDDKKADAMKSIIFEADMRERFPVHGCVEYISYLRYRLQQAEEELRHARAQLARCHVQEQLLKSMDSSDNNNYTNCDSVDYPWTNLLGSDDKAPFGLDPTSCSEYNNLSSTPIFPDQRNGEYFADYDHVPNYRPYEIKKGSHYYSSESSSQQCDLRNAASCLSLNRD